MKLMKFALLACLSPLLLSTCPAREPAKVIDLWPDRPPGETATLGPEQDTTKPSDKMVAGKPVIRLGNVSKPTLSIFRPAAGQDTGTVVLICPGGGYHILAWDLEGTEICQWLNSIGVTGALLKYRVPKRAGVEKHLPAFQDAQRALGLLRHHAFEWGFNSNRIGVLGFSAGGHLAAVASNNWQERSYPCLDAADTAACRPDFAVLIYPAYLTDKEKNDQVSAELAVSSNTPPTFIAMAQDDPVRVETALGYSAALHKVRVPFELHIYPTGGHGYGLRPTAEVVTTWPQRAAEWFRARSLLAR